MNNILALLRTGLLKQCRQNLKKLRDGRCCEITKLFNYRGWQAEVQQSPEDDGYYFGCIEGTYHMICFGGDTLEEARQCFMDTVDEYIERGILNQEEL